MQFSGRTWRPPHERWTPIIKATSGCAWSRCAFCDLFCEERFSISPLDRFCAGLARLCEVETKNLNRTAAHNTDRFPEDFRLQLIKGEDGSLRCQIGTSKTVEGRGGWRYPPNTTTAHVAVNVEANQSHRPKPRPAPPNGGGHFS